MFILKPLKECFLCKKAVSKKIDVDCIRAACETAAAADTIWAITVCSACQKTHRVQKIGAAVFDCETCCMLNVTHISNLFKIK